MIEAHFQAFFKENKLPTAGCPPYLLAVSGGLDSMVMANLFHQAGIPFAIAHVNFGLRGAESDGDQAFVQAWAAERQVAFYMEALDAKAEAQKGGVSTQMAARQLRYAFFERLRQIYHLDHLVLAHHKNDAVETALYHFSRGTGLAGLSGFDPVQGVILRPLAQISRADIHAYAMQNDINWREDSSNATSDYTRNFIRHQIVPRFEEINPAFVETAGRNLANISRSNRNYQFLLKDFLSRNITQDSDGRTQIALKSLQALPEPQELLRFWLQPMGFDEEQCSQISHQLHQVGWQCSTDSVTITVDRQALILSPKQVAGFPEKLVYEEDIMVRLGGGQSLFMTTADPASDLRTPPDTIIVPRKSLVFPLKVRGWQEGDHFQPFGMQGQSQKIQDFLVNQKVSVPDKSLVRILENGDGQIIWVMAYRLDHRFRVPQGTEHLVKFTFVQA